MEEEEQDYVLQILDMLNIKVCQKSPSDQDYHNDNDLIHALEKQDYLEELYRLRSESNYWSKKANNGDRLICALEKKVKKQKQENLKLKSKVAQENNRFVKIKNKLKIINERHGKQMAKNRHLEKELHDRTVDLEIVQDMWQQQQQNSLQIIEEKHKSEIALQTQIANKEKQFFAKQEENEKLAFELLQKINENEKLVAELAYEKSDKQGLADELSRENSESAMLASGLLRECHESQRLSGQVEEMKKEAEKLSLLCAEEKSKNAELETELVREKSENRRIMTELRQKNKEKDEADNQRQKLKDFVESCNNDLEENIHSFSCEYHVVFPDEMINDVKQEGNEEEVRLKRNLDKLAFLIRDTLQEFCSGANSYPYQSHHTSLSGSEKSEDECIEAPTAVNGSVTEENERKQQESCPYVPICSPITSEEDLSENTSDEL